MNNMTKKGKGKKKISLNVVLLVLLIILTLLASYFYLKDKNYNLFRPTSIKSLKEKSDKALLKIIAPKAENFIKSFIVADFEKAVIDFDAEMKVNFSISNFTVNQEQTMVKTGNLKELGKPVINKKEDNFLIMEYPQAKFEKEEKVIIQFVFKPDTEGNLKISGFWLDTPNGLWKNQ